MKIMEANPSVEFQAYTRNRMNHWDNEANRMKQWRTWGGAYHQRLIELYRQIIPSGSSILEIGCGTGRLLSTLSPSYGLGIDFSEAMIATAKLQHPTLNFQQADAHDLDEISGDFDTIILSDLVNDLWDVQKVITGISRLCQPKTRVVINYYSRVWEFPLWLAAKLGVSVRLLPQNWLTNEDVVNLLRLAGLDVISQSREVLFPINLPVISPFFNKFLVKFFPFNGLALCNLVTCRKPEAINQSRVSVIIPARNEAGNIEAAITRVPEMGAGTEIIFVEGNSTDNTFERIQQAIESHPERRCRLLRQPGKGKADAVRYGFESATGDILMILDADLTVLPEDLPRFFDALAAGRGEFINGVRLVYPMEKEAMRFLNFLGNKFFSLAFSWLLRQPVKDTLCGTKVMWKRDYQRIQQNRSYFGDFDPFGDFDLLFGATRLNLKIIDLPVRYHERTYGTTNISRWSHGWLLLKMVAFAAAKLKFI